MATKRKYENVASNDEEYNKKHTLDSDEEDSDDYERDDINDSDIEGGEDGVARTDGVKITPFNMKEELQEGHFDKDGHYHWNKNNDIHDNWLDNVDWMKVENDKNYFNPVKGDDSDESSDAAPDIFNSAMAYAKILEFMKPNETIQNALQRLGKNRPKLSSVERLRRKKAGIEDSETQKIAQLTELANDILTKTGNMDIYQEKYEQIKSRLSKMPSTSAAATGTGNGADAELFDMYSDDFEEKEKERLKGAAQQPNTKDDYESNDVMWEFKWKQDDTDIQGPYPSEKMLKWSQEKYFKEGVYVRKVGDMGNFYTSNRIDFDLYL